MSEHAYYNQAGHGPYETHTIGDLPLEEGGTLRNCRSGHAVADRFHYGACPPPPNHL